MAVLALAYALLVRVTKILFIKDLNLDLLLSLQGSAIQDDNEKAKRAINKSAKYGAGALISGTVVVAIAIAAYCYSQTKFR